jgi:pyruvate-formate lyase-activating enzyme
MTTPKLKQVIVELTNDCNSHCAFCPHRLSHRPVTHMPMSLLTKIVREVAELGFASDESCLGLCGIGEPLMHPEFATAMRIAADHGVAFGIGTNGHLLLDHIDNIIACDPSEVCMSVDAVTADVHHKLRTGTDFARVKTGVETYLQRIIAGAVAPRKLWVQMVVTTVNVHQAQQFADDWLPMVEQIPTARIFFKCVCPWPYHEANMFYPSPPPVLSDEVINHPQVVIAGFDPPIAFRESCSLFDGFGQVLSGGNYVPCCSPTEDYWGIGNLQDMTLLECFHSEKMEEMRHMPKTDIAFCKDCV